MAQNTSTVREKVLSRINLAPDLQLHVRKVNTDGLELVDIRQYVPSLKQYTRGVNIEARHLGDLIAQLSDAHKHVGVGNGSRAPGEGQGKLL